MRRVTSSAGFWPSDGWAVAADVIATGLLVAAAVVFHDLAWWLLVGLWALLAPARPALLYSPAVNAADRLEPRWAPAVARAPSWESG